MSNITLPMIKKVLESEDYDTFIGGIEKGLSTEDACDYAKLPYNVIKHAIALGHKADQSSNVKSTKLMIKLIDDIREARARFKLKVTNAIMTSDDYKSMDKLQQRISNISLTLYWSDINGKQ